MKRDARLQGTTSCDSHSSPIAPDAMSSDRNAVFWRWGDTRPSLVSVVDDLHRLTKHDISWHHDAAMLSGAFRNRLISD